jgi:two-component system sensor kinase
MKSACRLYSGGNGAMLRVSTAEPKTDARTRFRWWEIVLGGAAVAIVLLIWNLLPVHLPAASLIFRIVLTAAIILILHFVAVTRAQVRQAELATEALKESQSRLAGILDISPEAILSVDEQQRITLFNKGAEKTFGYSSSAVIGKPMELLIPLRFHDAHQRHVARFGGSSEPSLRMCDRRAVVGLRGDGTEFPAEASVSKLDLGGERIFTVIVRDITERVKAERELSEAHDELEKRVEQRTAQLAAANDSLRELSGRVLLLQDGERRRIARELHDSTAQNLLLLAVNLSTLQKQSHDATSGSDTLEQCVRLTEQTTSEIRTLSYLLHPPMLEEFGLGPALRWYLDGFAKRSGIVTTLDLDPELGRLAADVELTFFRVVQECLTNIHRHSESKVARVSLRRCLSQATLCVSDEGIGMPRDVLTPNGDQSSVLGVGIAGMRERLGHLGGHLDIESDEHGTEVRAVVPLESDQAVNERSAASGV